jgi:type II secretory pathway pseudopilin PulG
VILLENSGRSFRSGGERGYVLLTMLLMVSLLIVGAAALAPSIGREIRRDQETELIRRGIQYRRAIRQFTKKTGRFPMKIEDLEETNGVRFLRRRYKDPITGGEFKLLHMSDIPAATGTSSNAWSLQPGKNAAGDGSTAEDPGDGGSAGQGAASSKSSGSNSSANDSSGNTGFGGGVIIGVASASKKRTIREFDRRDHYNQWLFFYDPGFERPFEVQGPTPLTHPPANLQNAANPVSHGQNASNPAPNSANQNSQPAVAPQ